MPDGCRRGSFIVRPSLFRTPLSTRLSTNPFPASHVLLPLASTLKKKKLYSLFIAGLGTESETKLLKATSLQGFELVTSNTSRICALRGLSSESCLERGPSSNYFYISNRQKVIIYVLFPLLLITVVIVDATVPSLQALLYCQHLSFEIRIHSKCHLARFDRLLPRHRSSILPQSSRRAMSCGRGTFHLHTAIP